MTAAELERLLSESAAEVLESMFFTSVAGDAEPAAGSDPWICARLGFEGDPPGKFGVGTTLETGRKMAATFLGAEEESVSNSQIGEVICELANMLCGSVLSRLQKETRFRLSHPELDSPEAGWPANGSAVSRMLALDDGTLGMWLRFEEAP